MKIEPTTITDPVHTLNDRPLVIELPVATKLDILLYATGAIKSYQKLMSIYFV